jgi:hypothetical protein
MKTLYWWACFYLVLAYVVYHLIGVALCYAWEYI